MISSDSYLAKLMSLGGPFEVGNIEAAGRQLRVFKNAPQNLPQIFNRARSHGGSDFIVHNEQRLTFDEYFLRSDRLTAWLQSGGNIGPGEHVAICMQNSADWMIAFVAIINAGGVAVLINSRGAPEALLQAVSDADCKLVLADKKRHERLLQAGCELPILSDFLARIYKIEASPNFHQAQPDDMVAMFFTSGTTGRAKAAMITHRNIITGMMSTQMAITSIFLRMANQMGVTPDVLKANAPQQCSLVIFPLFHISGCSSTFLASLQSGGKLVLMDRWNADQTIQLIEQEKVTVMGGVPATHWDVVNSNKLGDYDLSSLRSISNGGQALPRSLLDAIYDKFPDIFIGAGYGMTELTGAIAQATGAAFMAKPDASGQILPMVDVMIADETGKQLPHGEVGEIWAKGALLMQGYYGRPEDTAKSMSGEWFKTGDVGKLDEEDYIYIIDRKTDMIISSGENIYCAEIEKVIASHAAIEEVTTFGVPDDRLGEKLIAYIRLKPDAKKTGIIDFAKNHLADYKVPKDFIFSSEDWPRNAMGKVKKPDLRELYLAKVTT